MRTLFTISNINSVYCREYITEILQKTPSLRDIHVLTAPPETPLARDFVAEQQTLGCTFHFYFSEALEKKRGPVAKVLRAWSRLLSVRAARGFDLVQINYVSVFWFLMPLFLRRSTRLILSIWGSDLLRASKLRLFLLRPLMRRADHITMETDAIRKSFSDAYAGQFDGKAVQAAFGTTNAEELRSFKCSHTREACKAMFGLPADKLCVFGGYNGYPSQRHLEILRLLETLPAEQKSRLCLVFHCGYGMEQGYHDALVQAMRKSSLDCRLIMDFLTGDRLQALRMCEDVMLNLQQTDIFSSSMAECLEAGSVVIKGDWLWYPPLEQWGAYLESIARMEDLPEMISRILEQYESYREKALANDGVILLLSWSATLDDWQNILT